MEMDSYHKQTGHVDKDGAVVRRRLSVQRDDLVDDLPERQALDNRSVLWTGMRCHGDITVIFSKMAVLPRIGDPSQVSIDWGR